MLLHARSNLILNTVPWVGAINGNNYFAIELRLREAH